MNPLDYQTPPAPKRSWPMALVIVGAIAVPLIMLVLLGSILYGVRSVAVSTPATAVIASPAPIAATPIPASPVQTVGNVRVTLLNISRQTRFGLNALASQAPPPATPGFEVLYVVEILGSGPIRQFESSDLQVIASGAPLSIPSSSITDDATDADEYKGELPKGVDPSRAVVHRQTVENVALPAGPITLKLEEGSDDHAESFSFDNLNVY